MIKARGLARRFTTKSGPVDAVRGVDIDVARPTADVIGSSLYVAYQEWEPDRPAMLVKAMFDRVRDDLTPEPMAQYQPSASRQTSSMTSR